VRVLVDEGHVVHHVVHRDALLVQRPKGAAGLVQHFVVHEPPGSVPLVVVVPDLLLDGPVVRAWPLEELRNVLRAPGLALGPPVRRLLHIVACHAHEPLRYHCGPRRRRRRAATSAAVATTARLVCFGHHRRGGGGGGPGGLVVPLEVRQDDLVAMGHGRRRGGGGGGRRLAVPAALRRPSDQADDQPWREHYRAEPRQERPLERHHHARPPDTSASSASAASAAPGPGRHHSERA
jgi:hypothetical protein